MDHIVGDEMAPNITSDADGEGLGLPPRIVQNHSQHCQGLPVGGKGERVASSTSQCLTSGTHIGCSSTTKPTVTTPCQLTAAALYHRPPAVPATSFCRSCVCPLQFSDILQVAGQRHVEVQCQPFDQLLRSFTTEAGCLQDVITCLRT